MIQIDKQMPKCCADCFALDDNGDYPFCLISHDQRGYTFNTRRERMPSCPLMEQKSVKPKYVEFEDKGMTWEKYEVATCGNYGMKAMRIKMTICIPMLDGETKEQAEDRLIERIDPDEDAVMSRNEHDVECEFEFQIELA